MVRSTRTGWVSFCQPLLHGYKCLSLYMIKFILPTCHKHVSYNNYITQQIVCWITNSFRFHIGEFKHFDWFREIQQFPMFLLWRHQHPTILNGTPADVINIRLQHSLIFDCAKNMIRNNAFAGGMFTIECVVNAPGQKGAWQFVQ